MLKSKRFRLKSHHQGIVEDVWISTFYQTFSLFNHILCFSDYYDIFCFIYHICGRFSNFLSILKFLWTNKRYKADFSFFEVDEQTFSADFNCSVVC